MIEMWVGKPLVENAMGTKKPTEVGFSVLAT